MTTYIIDLERKSQQDDYYGESNLVGVSLGFPQADDRPVFSLFARLKISPQKME